MKRSFLAAALSLATSVTAAAQSRVSDAQTYTNPALYAERRAEWLARVERVPDDVAVLEGAGDFFIIRERPLARELYERARALEPANPRWLDKIAQVHRLNASSGDPAEARLALAALEEAQALKAAGERGLPTQLPTAAFEAGDFVKAGAYATQLLAEAEASSRNWNYGNALHEAHTVLGRIAVVEGRFGDAATHLLAAGNTPGSPQLDSFGPNMALARDLLERGQTEPVLTYFEQCRKFWKFGGERLDTWTVLVRGGRVPEFGANLRY
jgi:hypothetical protein